MADNGEGSGDAQITFKVKTGGDKSHTITMSESATVLDLKTKLAGEDFENIPTERQRLIYSGRVLKNDDALSTYKIKPNNTIHMVKSAASNPTPQQSTSSSSAAATAPSAVPSNMAAGVANNPLAGLTGARYAGHINLPSRDIFGADGGMGAPPSDDQMATMLSDPAMLQTMNAALDNPQFIDYMIQSNPQLRNLPNAREIIQSPFMRQMMTNPQMLRNVMRMQRSMAGGGQGTTPFPAPGATDNTPTDAAAAGAGAAGNTGNAGDAGNQPPNLFGFPGGMPNESSLAQQLNALMALQGAGGGAGAGPFGQAAPAAPAPAAPGSGATDSATDGAATGGTPAAAGGNPADNPFFAIWGPPGGQGQGQARAQSQGQGQGQGQGQPQMPPNPFGQITPEMMQQAMNMWGLGGGAGLGGLGGAGGAASPPADTRPPEERYAEQLRQLNDMGFFDFDRNVAALRRSGGSVQGAIEYLLSGP